MPVPPGPELVRRKGLKDALASIPRGNGGESGFGRFLDRLLNPGISPHDLDPRTRSGAINLLSMFVGARGGKGDFVPPREIGPLYHGTPISYPPEKFDYQRTNPEGLFGKGMYLSDNPRVAESYANQVDRALEKANFSTTKFFRSKKEALDYIAQDPSRRRAAGSLAKYPHRLSEEDYALHAGGYFGVHEYPNPMPVVGPNIQRYSLHPSRLLHMDMPSPRGLTDSAIKYAQDRIAGYARFKKDSPTGYFNSPERMQEVADNILSGGPYSGGGGPRTPGQLYSRLSQELGYRYDANRFFRKLGFDALEYSGGTRIGGYGNHRAFVAIKPGVVRPYRGGRSHVSDYMRQRFLNR